MSNEAQGLVRNLAMAAPNKPILMAYANYADESGYCWPGIETIMFDTGYAKATVKRARAELIEAGWMGAKRRFGGSSATRLNLVKIAAAAVDRGDRNRLNHDIEFEPGQESAGQAQRAQREPNEKPTGEHGHESAGQSRRALSEPTDTRRALSEPTEGLSLSPPWALSEPLSISDPSEDPSVDRQDGQTDQSSKDEQPTAAEWALHLVVNLDFGKHKRPTKKQAEELARLVQAAVDDHGLSVQEVALHCRATLKEAKSSGVGYLRGGLAVELLPMPKRAVGVQLPLTQVVTTTEPVVSSDTFSAEDLVSRGLDQRFLPSRLKSVQ